MCHQERLLVFFSGLSTASALAHADSRPRKAHNVMAMEFVAASPNGMLLTFQFATYISAEKYAQPTVLITKYWCNNAPYSKARYDL